MMSRAPTGITLFQVFLAGGQVGLGFKFPLLVEKGSPRTSLPSLPAGASGLRHDWAGPFSWGLLTPDAGSLQNMGNYFLV